MKVLRRLVNVTVLNSKVYQYIEKKIVESVFVMNYVLRPFNLFIVKMNKNNSEEFYIFYMYTTYLGYNLGSSIK